MSHVPVMAGEVLRNIGAAPGQRMVDLTVGAGGHAGAFLRATAPTGTVVGCDRDREALELAEANLIAFGPRVTLRHGDSASCLRALLAEGVAVDAVLLDLGVSSMQLDEIDRGFTLREDAPLDMRMDASEGRTAADVVNELPEAELARVLRELGDEPRADRIARALVERRARRPFRTTGDLRDLVEQALHRRGGRIHPATRTFQALRMLVNRELELLVESLPLALRLLRPGGHLAVIAFHSGEDRIVKQWMREAAGRGEGESVSKRPITPEREEQRSNRRSRSARLRVFRKADAS
ncbi:MAG: 16S rRNA (cytosine(1402)-N(4))-methyltransferase RsmH [Planctomycetes bacterium]|nr:16S rRNA (cytosine(1402)-N(4))-methyltransferase RsmH [Planctomycetota bacterium]